VENWKQIPNWPMYEVSDNGRVRRGQKVLTPNWTGSVGKQYLSVSLTYQGRRRCARVHQLVAEAFIGAKPAGLHTAHLDGDRQNNSLPNLAYLTPSQNNLQKREHGTMVCGSRQHNSTLSQEQVDYIRSNAVKRDPARSYAALARRFGVSEEHIGKIVAGKAWRHALPEGGM